MASHRPMVSTTDVPQLHLHSLQLFTSSPSLGLPGELQKTRNECLGRLPSQPEAPNAPGARSGLTPIAANCLLSDPLEHPTAPRAHGCSHL